MNLSTRHCGFASLLANSVTRVGGSVLQTTNYVRQEVVPLVFSAHQHTRRNATKILVSWGCLAVAVVLVSQPCSSGQRLIETSDWSLLQLVDHLQSKGLAIRVVPTHKSGNWSNSIYLTTDPEATWLSLQPKSRSLERIEQWHGLVLVERLTNKPGPRWDVDQWGEHGLQIDRFVFFGDSEMIKRIGQSVQISQPRCAISRWLSSY